MSQGPPARQPQLDRRLADALQTQTRIAQERRWAELRDGPRGREPKRLLRFGHRTFSQTDEDGILQEIFRRIGTGERGNFVEFGVGRGDQCNTLLLLVTGWSGLWLEGDPQRIEQVRRNTEAFVTTGQLEVREAMVTAENVNDLIGEEEVDLLSIDTDWNDYWLWKAVNMRPRVVVIEYNAAYAPPVKFTVPYNPKGSWDGTSYFGASLAALTVLGKEKGYRLVGCSASGVNAFFVRDDLVHDRFHGPFTAEEHYEPPRYELFSHVAGRRVRAGLNGYLSGAS